MGEIEVTTYSPGYWYLATPYKLYPDGKQAAYEAALQQTAALLARGIAVYSPIVHNHPLSLNDSLRGKNDDFNFWVELVDKPLMEAAGGLLVCTLSSWESSAGIAYEIDLFKSCGKPVVFFSPGRVPTLPELDPPLGAVLAGELAWQNATFPLSTSESRAEHLLREAHELRDDPENALEMADILLLLSHLANGRNGPNVSLAQAVIKKQHYNRARLWGKPDEAGVVEHIRETLP